MNKKVLVTNLVSYPVIPKMYKEEIASKTQPHKK
jgi:hypothetical protein